MGSKSDLDIMSDAAIELDKFNISYEVRIISAHRTPKAMMTYASEAKTRGLQVIIAGAGGSAHLPGMTASETSLPVIAVPIKRSHHDHEALWSNIKMPPGIPLATMPENGARNAALLAVRILSLTNATLLDKYHAYITQQTTDVLTADKLLQREGWQENLRKPSDAKN